MPFTGKTFRARHNHKLPPRAASKAASQANAMIRQGVPEGTAIATANKTGNRLATKRPYQGLVKRGSAMMDDNDADDRPGMPDTDGDGD